MTGDTERCLDKLESAIDPAWEREKLEIWKRVLDFDPWENGFRASVTTDGEVPDDWPDVLVNEAINDPEKMLLQQLGPVYDIVCRRTYSVPNIRCNYGTGILSTVFGADLFWMDDELDTLPTSKPLEGDGAIDELLDAGVPDINNSLGGRTFETAEYFKEALAPYPRISEVVWIYHPDLQGPIDITELLWGSGMFLAFYSEPEKLKALAALVTETYIRFMKRWFEVVPPRDEAYMAHWGGFFKGQVMLRDDSIMNLSGEMYGEFVKPYDERILDEFGGGGIHFCGHADHCIDIMTDSENLTVVNMSQPEMNDMQKIYEATVPRGVILNCPYNEAKMKGLDITKGVILR